MISEVFKFEDGMVIVFDEKGEPLREYQGRYDDVRAKILTRAPKEAKFYHGGWPHKKLVSRKEW